jgi:hypothetical protein
MSRDRYQDQFQSDLKRRYACGGIVRRSGCLCEFVY